MSVEPNLSSSTRGTNQLSDVRVLSLLGRARGTEARYGEGATVTFTWALVQQHWKPPPPSPETSFD